MSSKKMIAVKDDGRTAVEELAVMMTAVHGRQLTLNQTLVLAAETLREKLHIRVVETPTESIDFTAMHPSINAAETP